MNRTMTHIAIGLLLAASVPAASASDPLLSQECVDQAKQLLGRDSGLASLLASDVDLASCTPSDEPCPETYSASGVCIHPDLSEPCPSGSYGIGTTCIETGDVQPESCPEGQVGFDLKGGKGCIDDPSIEQCPAGSAGAVIGGTRYCKTVPQVPGDDVKACPPGTVGVVIDDKPYCRSIPELPDLPGGGSGDEEADTSCAKTDDDVWPGGSHVECEYACPAFSTLFIEVSASDLDAKATGSTSCADQSAPCDMHSPSCVGSSPGTTTYAGANAECDGYTDEANSSPVTAHCWALGPYVPERGICYLAPELCTLTAMEMRNACLAPYGELDPAVQETVLRLALGSPGTFSDLVAIETSGSLTTAMILHNDGSDITCRLELL
jgi:hypothetical protein